MNFQGLGAVENADWYLDVAFRNANKAASGMRGSLKGNRLIKSRKLEIAKVETVKKVLDKQLMLILKGFPSIDGLPEFYQELVKITLDYAMLKKSLGGVNWAMKQINKFAGLYAGKIKGCTDYTAVNGIRTQYYGRISSVVKQIKKELLYLEECRKVMKDFPSIKQNSFTVCIAGFPNVGKTTLLSKITTATPEIASYAFTTKHLNIGYAKTDVGKIQFIDTPGTLDRFNKMNSIEKQAYLSIKYCADVIVYVFDITEPFPLKDQKKLLLAMKKFDIPILLYLSKVDVLKREDVDSFVNKGSMTDLYTDKKKLFSRLKELAKEL